MGLLINIRAKIPPEQKGQIGRLVEALAQDALDEPVLRVVEHNNNTSSSKELSDQFRQATGQ